MSIVESTWQPQQRKAPALRVKLPRQVFNRVYLPFLNVYSRIQVFYGGSSSGKSVFLAQRCVYDLMRGGRNYLILRQVARTVRHSVFEEVCRVISRWNVGGLFDINKSEMSITCQNGYQILFAGLDDVEKLKSVTVRKGSITDIWIEEATEVSRKSVKSLIKRQRGGDPNVPKRLTLSFNPIIKTHWIYEEYFAGIAWADDQTQYITPELAILKTWYIHNRWLTPGDIQDLVSEEDPYFRTVYTFGGWGILGNVIFTNWKVQDLSGMRDQFTNPHHGLDFGFSDDPAAMPCTHYDSKHKIIYIYDELYERGLTNDLLAVEIKNRIGKEPVAADNAEPKSIAELQDCGVNVYPAMKGRDSVLFGIQWLQQQTIIVDSQCIATRNELMQYKWKEDPSGQPMRQPVDKNNHIIDGLRYGYEEESSGGLRAY